MQCNIGVELVLPLAQQQLKFVFVSFIIRNDAPA